MRLVATIPLYSWLHRPDSSWPTCGAKKVSDKLSRQSRGLSPRPRCCPPSPRSLSFLHPRRNGRIHEVLDVGVQEQPQVLHELVHFGLRGEKEGTKTKKTRSNARGKTVTTHGNKRGKGEPHTGPVGQRVSEAQTIPLPSVGTEARLQGHQSRLFLPLLLTLGLAASVLPMLVPNVHHYKIEARRASS